MIAGRKPPTAKREQRGSRLDCVVVHEAGQWEACGPIEPMVTAVATAIAKHVELPAARTDAVVVLSSDLEVMALNKEWRQQDKPTNVLSFPSPPQPGPAPAGMDAPIGHFIGDIVLAEETIAREAAELDIPLSHHVTHLVLHGLLHLLGMDHETAAEAAAMEGLETGILAALGVPDPYAD